MKCHEFTRYSKSLVGKWNPVGEYGVCNNQKYRASLNKMKALHNVQRYSAGSKEAHEK